MDEILSSWKEIAAYFGKGVRTVQRWEEQFGLPVRRIRQNGTNRHILFARMSELDNWLSRAVGERARRRQDGDGSNGAPWSSGHGEPRGGDGDSLLELIEQHPGIPRELREEMSRLLRSSLQPHLVNNQGTGRTTKRKSA